MALKAFTVDGSRFTVRKPFIVDPEAFIVHRKKG